MTSGTWVRTGGVVLERGFAEALGVRVGDRVTISGRGYPVVGIAISAATPVYPWSDGGQGPGPNGYGGRLWLTTADARAAAGASSTVYLVHLKLTDPAEPLRWRDTVFTHDRRGDSSAGVRTWRTVLQTDTNLIRDTEPDLVVGGWLLAAAAIVTLAALAAVRATRDNRRAGLLKAVGAGPRTVAAVLLTRYVLLTALATVLGLTVGSLTAPALADPSAGLLATTGPPSAGVVAAAVFLAVVVAGTGTLGPVVRAARGSTVDALADPVHHPRLTGLTAYLPTSLLVGVRLLARRPGRAVLTAIGTATIGVTVAALLAYRATPGPDSPALTAVHGRADQVLVGVTLALVALSGVNSVFVGWSTAVQARRALAVTRTLGATPGQVVIALCTAQLLPVLPAVVVGMPAGTGLYSFFHPKMVLPPGSWLLGAGLAVVLAVCALTAVPAWVHTRRPTGCALEPA
ncbi:hypothetical protein I6J71_22615 [Amycolatopsis sp. FDAARGOS 1241]|nr:hypothetical protein I6J71_22615 [Amycolatopsis sp. FDAARGOS 1241]